MMRTNQKGMRIQSQKKKFQDLVAHHRQAPVSRAEFLAFVEPPPTRNPGHYFDRIPV